MFTSPRNMACKNRTAELKSRQRCNLTSSIWALFIYPTNTWSSVLYTRGFTENRWMFLILVVGSCCGAYRTWKPYDDASFDGIESFRTAKIQVNLATLLNVYRLKLCLDSRDLFLFASDKRSFVQESYSQTDQTGIFFQQFGLSITFMQDS